MPPSTPYRRQPPSLAIPRRVAERGLSAVAVTVALAWVFALVRVATLVLRHPPSRPEDNVAWLVVLLAPIVIGAELRAERRRA